MDQQSSDDASHNGEGFEAQKIYIEKKVQPETVIRLNTDDGNDIIDDLRPKDLLPRSIYTELDLQDYPLELQNTHTFQEPQKLVPLIHQPYPKQKKFSSLSERFKNSFSSMVYNKFPDIDFEDYLHSYVNLQKVVDYSALNFVTFQNSGKNTSPFNSNFESGNLLYAYKVENTIYDLILQNDTNTRGYNQWFYFSYEFLKPNETTFNIVNMIKKKTLFLKGVKPLFFAQNEDKKWKQVSSQIKYYKNGVLRENGEPYYTLSFKHTPKSVGKVYFSLNLPYTYSRMISLVKEVQSFTSEEFSVQKRILCYSISNNAIPYLIFKSKTHSPQKQILFFARQHPGETISSHIMQSLIKSLLIKPMILQKFQILVVPMINVDGVIYGNFRTNLAGYDINRQWKQTDKWMNPEIYALKKLIKKQPSLEFVLDLHGHSKKFNSFIYACKNQSKFEQKLFPYLMSRNSLFNIQSCTYGLTRDKTSTARAFVKDLGIHHIYTFQTSFYGYGADNNYHRFQSRHFDSIGQTIILSLQQLYFSASQQLQKYEEEINKIIENHDQELENQSIDSGSDSNPSEDELTQNERQKHVIPTKVLDQKKRKVPKKLIQSVKKQTKKIKFVEKQKRNSSFQISNREVYSSEKYQFRRTFQNSNRVANKTLKTPVNKIVQEKQNKTVTKFNNQPSSNDSNKIKKSPLVVTSNKPKEIKSLLINKKQEIQQERETISNLFLSSIKRSSVKSKRNHKSLVDERSSYTYKDETEPCSIIQKDSQVVKRHGNQRNQRQFNLMVSDMRNSLKSRLDKIVDERIREKMSQSLICNVPKMRRSQRHTGISGIEPQSNLLQIRQRLGKTTLIDRSRDDEKQMSNHRSRRSRNEKGKKQLIFLSQLMRPKVQMGKNYQMQVMGNNSARGSNKNKYMLYFNQFI